ncbi:lamin tail domain-containing protein [Flavisolibacter sp. BT320]|nr:lamin tail domain-containing protein [Flavisolibacter longurius]
MKANIIRNCFTLLALLLLANNTFAQVQGKVVINEYMPWTANGCGINSEFVELLNFGPGPVDIGCYILTNGKKSVTIPAQTILQPGEFYTLAGQDYILGTCANIDSTGNGVTADLNWNTCNCTDNTPSASDGFLSDGGSNNTPLVLFDANLNVIDAVARATPAVTFPTITSAAMPGGCGSKTFNIGNLPIVYEELGMSTGRANSFARVLDGDCGWVKDPRQSGNASNNRAGRTTDISYQFDMVSPTSCGQTPTGSVSIYVKHSNYASIFPMSYTIVVDSDNNGIYDFSDQYTTVVDYDPPFIEIDNLPVGRFRVTVGSVKGCYLRTFDFTIIPCNPGTLPVRLDYFKNKGGQNGQQELEWLLHDVQNLQSIVVEKAAGDRNFIAEKIITGENARGSKLYTFAAQAPEAFPHYRLKLVQKNGKSFYSPEVYLGGAPTASVHRLGPNPATDKLVLQYQSAAKQIAVYTIYNTNGMMVGRGNLSLNNGTNNVTIPVQSLPPGTYQLQVAGSAGGVQPISFRFVKH